MPLLSSSPGTLPSFRNDVSDSSVDSVRKMFFFSKFSIAPGRALKLATMKAGYARRVSLFCPNRLCEVWILAASPLSSAYTAAETASECSP